MCCGLLDCNVPTMNKFCIQANFTHSHTHTHTHTQNHTHARTHRHTHTNKYVQLGALLRAGSRFSPLPLCFRYGLWLRAMSMWSWLHPLAGRSNCSRVQEVIIELAQQIGAVRKAGQTVVESTCKAILDPRFHFRLGSTHCADSE